MGERRLVAALGLALALAAGLALAATASAATGAGAVRIKLDKRAAKSLHEAGIELAATGSASSHGRALRIPVGGGTVGSTAQLANRGGLQLRAGATGARRRVARLRSLRTVIAAGRGYVTARYRGQQLTLLRIGAVGEVPFDPLTGAVAVAKAPVRFERSTAATLADRLGIKRLRARLGTVRIEADVTAAPAEQAEPPLRPRPGTAVDITSATLSWRARVSWIDYLHAAGEQGGTRTSGGATDRPAEVIPPSTQPRVYQYDFPFAAGWIDAASGTANVGFSGTVTYYKLIQPFGIDLDTSNLEIELGGPEPRAIATLNGRGNNADQQNRRAVVVDLDQSAVIPVVTSGPDGTTYTWTDIPGIVPDGNTAWPIAGYYQPGGEWGSMTVSLTVAP